MSDIPGPESNFLPEHQQQTSGAPPRPGRIREQQPGQAPRPETVGEARARAKAQRERAELERKAQEAAELALEKKRRRRKQMIGAGVGVGVVGAIAGIYLIASSDSGDTRPVATQTAYCQPDNSDTVVDESYCSRGTYNPSTGLILLGGSSYRYHYGGTLSGNRVIGGSYDRPANTAFTTPSGSAIDSSKATSFGTDGKSNANTKPAPPKAGSSGGSANSGGDAKAGTGGKNIQRGGIGAGSANGGGAKPKSGSSGGS